MSLWAADTCKEKKTKISRLVDYRDSVWAIRDPDFNNLAKVHKYGTGKDQCVIVDFALADYSFSVPRDWKYGHTKYDLLGSVYVKDGAIVLANVMRQVELAKLFYPTL